MNDAEIDRVLSKQDEILPSSGFVASVMDAVQAEAAVPPPIPFPWKRALPMLVLAAAALLAVLVMGIAEIAQAGRQSTAAYPMVWNVLSNSSGSLAGWTTLALLVAFIPARLCMRLVGTQS